MNGRTIGYWATVGLFSFAMTGSGVINILGAEEIVANITRLGFPAWFALWLGVWKVAGVVVLLAPGLLRLKEWAYAGFTIAMTSAFVSHIAAGDAVGMAVPPLVLLSLGLASWALRPDSRRLPA